MIPARVRTASVCLALAVACSSAPEQPVQPEQPEAARLFPSQATVVTELLARVDADRDGLMSQAEYGRYWNTRDAFSNMDGNGDLFIDGDELERALRRSDPGYAKTPNFNATYAFGDDAAE